MNESPPCPSCGEGSEEVYPFDFGPTGEEQFVCGACGFTFSVTPEGDPAPLNDI